MNWLRRLMGYPDTDTPDDDARGAEVDEVVANGQAVRDRATRIIDAYRKADDVAAAARAKSRAAGEDLIGEVERRDG